MPFDLLNPLTDPRWNETVLNSSGYSVFHSANWARVLAESYGFFPRYRGLVQGRKFQCLLPLMEISSRLTGRRGVCLPFSDYTFPIGSPLLTHQVTQSLLDEGRQCGWRYLELRAADHLADLGPASSRYYRHWLNLSPGEKQLFTGLRPNYRSKLRKAQREGLFVTRENSPEAMEIYFRLHCLTRRRQGLPPQPLRFFRKIFEHFLVAHLGWVGLARRGRRFISAAVFLQFGSQVLYKFGASDPQQPESAAGYAVMWDAISHSARQGFAEFCFGRTDTHHTGLLQFKEGWGAQRQMLNYLRYDFRKNGFLSRVNSPGSGSVIFRKMPVPLLRACGTLLYRHFA